MAAVMHGREPDLVPGIVTFSGNTSPDASLEIDYHREKVTGPWTDSGDDCKDSSDDEEGGGSRGRTLEDR